MDAGSQTLRLWYGTAQAAHATVQQITLITLTSTVSAGYGSNEYEAAVVEQRQVLNRDQLLQGQRQQAPPFPLPSAAPARALTLVLVLTLPGLPIR